MNDPELIRPLPAMVLELLRVKQPSAAAAVSTAP
jgi:hypothetical protein